MRTILRFLPIAAILSAPAAAQLASPAVAKPDYGTAVPMPGSWRVVPVGGGSSAVFATSQGVQTLTIKCDRTIRRVSISRPAAATAPYLYVWTSSASRNLPASFNPSTRVISADLSARDPLLDALAFSRGRIVVGPSTGGVLVAPMWPEIIRVIEDCRS